MAFEVGDLFSILGGGAWLAKECVQEICEQADNRARSECIKSFVSENTDEALEEKYDEELLKPNLHNSFWETLEKYKRENPIWCKEHEEARWCGQYTQRSNLCWQDIGYKRPVLTWGVDAYKTIQEKWGIGKMPKWFVNQEKQFIERDRIGVLMMLMSIHGKMCKHTALIKAREKYTPKRKNSL